MIDRFGRSDRDLSPQVVDGMFEDVIAECLEDVPEPSVVLATDGSVVPNIPKSGWGYVIRDSCGNLRVGHGGCKMLLSSMRAEIEAVSRGLNLMREVAPDTPGIMLLLNILLTHRYTTYDDTLGLVQKRSVTLISRHRSHIHVLSILTTTTGGSSLTIVWR